VPPWTLLNVVPPAVSLAGYRREPVAAMESPLPLCLSDLNGHACLSPARGESEKSCAGPFKPRRDLSPHAHDHPAAKAELKSLRDFKWRRKGDVGVCSAHGATGCSAGDACGLLHAQGANGGWRSPPGLAANGTAGAPPRRGERRHPPPRATGPPSPGQNGGPRLVSDGVRLASQLRGKVKTADGALEGLEKLALSLPDSPWSEVLFVSSRTKEELDTRMRDLVAAYETLLRSMRVAPGAGT